MAFRKHQKVVCVDGKPKTVGQIIKGHLMEIPECGYPVEGQVYTVAVAGVTTFQGAPGIDLVEMPHPSGYWAASRFRPVVTTSTGYEILEDIRRRESLDEPSRVDLPADCEVK